MLVKLNVIAETERAYKISEGSWVPKSCLDNTCLPHPYYVVKGWWINKLLEGKSTERSIEAGLNKLQDIISLKADWNSLPKEVVEKYRTVKDNYVFSL
jgi:hypothetical protein